MFIKRSHYDLYLLPQLLPQDGFKPAKYFSIDRVYRNETLDATHLAEFHQVEGVVADHNFSIKNLMGVIGVRLSAFLVCTPTHQGCFHYFLQSGVPSDFSPLQVNNFLYINKFPHTQAVHSKSKVHC